MSKLWTKFINMQRNCPASSLQPVCKKAAEPLCSVRGIAYCILCFLFLFSLLTACVTDSPSPITGTPRSRSLEVSSIEPPYAYTQTEENLPMPIAVLHKTENALHGVYEPSDGIYLAAWLEPHTSMQNFINQAGQSHAAFVHDIHLGDDIPVNWVLQCISVLATPVLVVLPPVEETDMPIGNKISQLAQRLGAFQLPMFVAFYPASSSHNMTPAEYAVIFRYARALFLEYAPLVAFVWVAPTVNSTVHNPFFPGHHAVDWVGVPLFARRDSYGFAEDVISNFEFFYDSFSPHHPIMMLPLGVSHFSRADHSYRLAEAAKEILRVYQALASFPRVGLVAYGDAFSISPATNDDFAITIESYLMAAYAKATTNSLFLQLLERDAHGSRWVRCAFTGYYWDGNVFIDIETLNNISMPVPRITIEINERTFVELDRIVRASFCETRRVVMIE